jgi:GNAT superfamily N-acetyltransferase
MELLPIIIYRFDSYVEPMEPIEYRTAGYDEIDRIRPLWEKLNAFHHAKASRFRKHYEQVTFDHRKAYFGRLNGSGVLYIDFAEDRKTGQCIGYCVSSVSPDRTGEIESLFVEDGYRSCGVGTTLVLRALGWMDRNGAERKRVAVGDGNESAGEFYRRFGFFPRLTVLEQVPGSE